MTQVQQRAPTHQELFGDEEEDDFSEEEDEYDEEEEEEEEGEEDPNSEAKKNFNYTQDRLDAARQKLKEKYNELNAKKASRTIVTLQNAPDKGRKRTITHPPVTPPTAHKQITPPSSTKSTHNNSSAHAPITAKAPFKVAPTVSRSPSAITKGAAKPAASTRDRILKALKKKPGSTKVKSGMKTHKL